MKRSLPVLTALVAALLTCSACSSPKHVVVREAGAGAHMPPAPVVRPTATFRSAARAKTPTFQPYG